VHANQSPDIGASTRTSPLMRSDRLPRLAEDADIARLRLSAEHLLALAEGVPDQPARLHA
jgi:hypothetical protein